MVRTEARIDAILEQIRTLWLKHPDQRLGQLLANNVAPSKELALVSDETVFKELCAKNNVKLPEFEGFIKQN